MKKLYRIDMVVLFLIISFLSISSASLAGELSAPQQDCSKWGPDSTKTIEAISLYREFFKQDNYKDAISYWRYVFLNAPGAKERTFLDGVKLYKDLIDNAKDENLKSAYTDTLLMIYDQRMKCFGVTGDLLARKAIEMIVLLPKNVEEYFNLFKESIKMTANETNSSILYYYIMAAIRAQNAGIITDVRLLEIYSEVLDILEFNINKGGKSQDSYKSTQEKIDEAIAKTGLLNCDNLKPMLEKQYKADPNNKDLWKKIYTQMRAARCASDPLFIEVAEKLMTEEPDAEKARILAISASNSGDFNKALKFYKQALELEQDNESKAEYCQSIAEIYYKLKDYPTARTYALKAASLKNNWGDPYLLIGDMYRASGSICGPGTGFESQVITWPAIDKYETAKSIDPSVTSKADQRIVDSKQYMPSKAECFFQGLSEGDNFEVKCWINETTTVRFGPEQ